MKKILIITAMLFTGLASAQIVITEVLEGNASLKYVELHNLTNAPIDLSGWILSRYANANTTSSDLPLTGTIAARGYFVIANNQTNFNTDTFGFDADLYNSGTVSHNGDDEYELYNGMALVDAFAGEHIGNTIDFAANVVSFRVMAAYPNNGDWFPPAPISRGGTTPSPTGFWTTLPVTSFALGLANGTPGTKGGGGGVELPVELMNFSVE